ncbi:phage integrase family protein [Burkholderia ambifaria IOP40-10]|uniref:Phage integrase family protein n=1 Tax=Burkholderia ambifaria IOP40-10 TaxID=396596 RepID=B1FH39_9BURK|nr:phage integrase family protein [Burkholderia ambifaria IOP40-10]
MVAALQAHGIRTLADLTVRIPRRRRWWIAIAGLGAAGARHVEAFFAAYPVLTERARALIVAAPAGDVVPWEQLRVPHEVDGSHGQFRAPRAACLLNATNDYEAIQSWLSLHESAATQRAYRKEAERLILWAIIERGRALSSLTTDDAIAYRAFLRRPVPRERWIGPSRPRQSIEWRPFTGPLSARSAAYALNVLSALFRWLIEQRYVLANPFAGVKVKSQAPRAGLDVSRGFSEGEWLLIRTLADGLEWSYGWSVPAAQRLRFLLDFGYATGLRASELVGATLADIRRDEHGDHWLHVLGKGASAGR